MPRISSCDYCDYRHLVPDYCIKTECKVYWAMVEQNEKMEEHNRSHRDQQYVPEDFVKPKTEIKREFIALSQKPKPQISKGGIPSEPRRATKPESS